MTAPVLPLRPRRTASDPLARLLDLETEVIELLAIGRRVGQRLNELEAERTQIEQALREQDQLSEPETNDLIALGCALEAAPCLAPEGR